MYNFRGDYSIFIHSNNFSKGLLGADQSQKNKSLCSEKTRRKSHLMQNGHYSQRALDCLCHVPLPRILPRRHLFPFPLIFSSRPLILQTCSLLKQLRKIEKSRGGNSWPILASGEIEVSDSDPLLRNHAHWGVPSVVIIVCFPEDPSQIHSHQFIQMRLRLSIQELNPSKLPQL